MLLSQICLRRKTFYPNTYHEHREEKPMTFETNKNLGGAGALIIFVSFIIGAIPGVGGFTGILTLVGAILVLAALKGFADYYRERRIFNNALYALIVAIIGVVIVILIGIFALTGLLNALGLNIRNVQDWAQLANINWQTVDVNILLGFGAELLVGLVVLFIFVLITAILLRSSLNLTAHRSGVGMFHTTGIVLLVGAILTIIVIGVLLIWISMLLLAVAFFSMRPVQSVPPTTVTQTQAPTPV